MLYVIVVSHTCKLLALTGAFFADSIQHIAMPPKTSGKAAAKSGKASKAVVNGDKKKKKGKRKESYAIYIYKVFVVTIDCMY